SRRRHTRFSRDWSSDVCSSDLGTPKVFFHQGAKYKTKKQGRALAAKLHPDISDQAENGQHPDVEYVVIQRIHTDGAKHQYGWKQDAVGHLEQFDPYADQGKVQNDQHEVANPHRD